MLTSPAVRARRFRARMRCKADILARFDARLFRVPAPAAALTPVAGR